MLHHGGREQREVRSPTRPLSWTSLSVCLVAWLYRMTVVDTIFYSAGKESKVPQQVLKALHPGGLPGAGRTMHSLVHIGCFPWRSLLPLVAPKHFLFVLRKFSILKHKSTLAAVWDSAPFILHRVRPRQNSSPSLCHQMEDRGLFSLHTCSVFLHLQCVDLC